MLKKNLSLSAFALAALASSVFAQQQAELDVIYRDFPVTAPGFEEFMACDDKNNSNSTSIRIRDGKYTTDYGDELRYSACNGGASNGKRGYINGPDNLTGCTGWEWEGGAGQPIRVTLGMVGETLFYDTANCNPDDIMEDPDGGDRQFVKYRYCARPTPGNNNCSSFINPGNKIEQWFSNSADARELRDILVLDRQSDGKYLINFDYNTSNNWNVDGSDNGFFPLDQYDDGSDKTWGRQSLNYWCPDSNGDVCGAWRANGGPRNPTAGINAANSKGVRNKLHNYGFSAAGSGQFKYVETANDVFEFIGDDDMWIFIDGKLVADLGGVHLAAPAKINIKEYAQNNGWQNNTTHVVNFFYMDRNTDGSNFKLVMSLSDLAPPRFGAPRILKAKTIQKQDGTSETTIYVNNKILNLKEFISDYNGGNEFPIIITKRGNTNILAYKLETIGEPIPVSGEGYAYVITGKVCESRTVCGGNLILSSGDSLSFNVWGDNIEDGGHKDPNNLRLSSKDYYIKANNAKQTPATTTVWAINTTDLPAVPVIPKVPDQNPVKPPFVILDGGGSVGGNQGDGTVPGGAGGPVGSYNGGGKFPNITQVWDPKTGTMVSISGVDGAGDGKGEVHGFGTVGKQIPPQRTGELILTVFPSTTDADAYKKWLEDPEIQKMFGIPPPASTDPNEWWGLVDPTNPASAYGGYQFLKNGFPNESNTKGSVKIAPTRCTTILKDGEPRINCLNFSLVAKQPFQIAVTIYDQLGNFVTQYRETLSEQEFRNVVQAPNYIDGGALVNPNGSSTGCDIPTDGNYGAPTTLTTNGLINVNVNIYPFSAEGRRFGNGVYIAKIDRVDLPFKDGIEKDPNGNGYTCASAGGGNATRISPTFVRYHADQKFSWMRSISK